MGRRLAAVAALVVGAATVVLGVVVAVSEFPRSLALLACLVVAGAAVWYGVLRRGVVRVVGLTVGGLAVVGALVLVVATGTRFVDLFLVLGLAGVVGPGAHRPRRPRRPAACPASTSGGAVLQPAFGRRQG